MHSKPYTVKEVAVILGVSVKTVRKLIREGKLPAFRPGKRDYRIWPHDLEDFIAREGRALRHEVDDRRQTQNKEVAK